MRSNSEDIAKKHKEIYEAFMQRCQYVASAPGVFFWGGEFAVRLGGLAICQQIPQRVYVGLEKVDSQGNFQLDIGRGDKDHMKYDHEGGFKPVVWSKGLPTERESIPITEEGLNPEMEKAVRGIAEDLKLLGRYVLLSIHELRWSSGTGWSGAFGAALTGALYAAAGQISVRSTWEKEWWDAPTLKRINAHAWELERIFHKPFASGCGVVCSTAPCPTPQLYALRWRDETLSGTDPTQISLNTKLDSILVTNAMPFCQLDQWNVAANFDIGLIYSGISKSTSRSINRSTTELAKKLEKGLQTAMKLWPGGKPGLSAMQNGRMFELCKTQQLQHITGQDIQRLQMESLSGTGLRVLESLTPLLRDNPPDNEYLAEALNSVDGGIRQLDLGWPEADLIRGAVLTTFWNHKKQVALKSTGGAHGGSMVLFCPKLDWNDKGEPETEGFAKELISQLESVNSTVKKVDHEASKISLDWISSRDGLDGHGLRILKGNGVVLVQRSETIIVGDDKDTDTGLLGWHEKSKVMLDLCVGFRENEKRAHTISVFGIPKSGKSYTLGVILEMALAPQKGIRQGVALPAVVFHYDQNTEYKPEFVKMMEPNPVLEDIQTLKRYGAEPTGVKDVVVLVPPRRVEERSREFLGATVMPLVFSPDELGIQEWLLLMGVPGSEALYVQQIKELFTKFEGVSNLRLDYIRQVVDNSNIAKVSKSLASERLNMASPWIGNSSLNTTLKPGRLVILDIRDRFIDTKDATRLCLICLRLLQRVPGENNRPMPKLVILDEAHKYMRKEFEEEVKTVVNQVRQYATTLVIASQNPDSIPSEVIEKSSIVILHQLSGTKQIHYVKRTLQGLARASENDIANLSKGCAIVWSSKSNDSRVTSGGLKVSIRPRFSRHA